MRYLPLTPADRADMLSVIGAKSIDDLFVDVPGVACKAELFDLPRHAGEMEVERELAALAALRCCFAAGLAASLAPDALVVVVVVVIGSSSRSLPALGHLELAAVC